MKQMPFARLRRRLLALLGPVLLLAAVPAGAVDRGPVSMEILVDGRPLREYVAGGTTYVEALRGHEYSIRLRNRTGRRVAVALSVDGLNTIDAKHGSAREATKWILAPRQSITLDGWQTSQATARRFFFTTEEESYGAWLGDTRNLGVISAAVFHERVPRPAPITRDELRRERGDAGRPSAPRVRSEAGSKMGDDAPRTLGEAEAPADDDHAATGIGRELDHRVRRVEFDAEAHPAAVLQVRYEYRDALARLGVLPRPYARKDDVLERRERASGFEGLEFAPDPYR